MKDIKEFQIGEEVRIREDIIVGFIGSTGVIFVNEMKEYKGKIVRINEVFSHSILASIRLHIEGSRYTWVPEFFADDPVIGVKFPDCGKEYYYKCYFPVMLGDKLIVDVNGTENEVMVTNLNGDAKKATKYVRRKAEKIVFAYQSDTHWGSFVEGCILPKGGIKEGPISIESTTAPVLYPWQVAPVKALCKELSVGVDSLASKKATSIEVPDFNGLKLEAARVDHPVAIEIEDPLAVSAGKERKGSGRCFTKANLIGAQKNLRLAIESLNSNLFV